MSLFTASTFIRQSGNLFTNIKGNLKRRRDDVHRLTILFEDYLPKYCVSKNLGKLVMQIISDNSQ